MRKIDIFKTRVLIDNKVYLMASDVRKAFGYDNMELLRKAYPEIIKKKRGLPELVLESDFNTLMLADLSVAERLKHLELTRVETLRTNTESIKTLYPLKYLIAGNMFRMEAAKAGFQSVEEYIEKVDFMKEIESEKEKLLSKRDLLDCIQESRETLKSLIDFDTLDKYGLSIQQYIHIKECVPHLESFVVGLGIFFSVYDSDFEFQNLKIEDHDLIIPTYEYEKGDIIENYGHDTSMRDYRKFSTLDNIIYILKHKEIEDAGVDLLCCHAPGIDFYISQEEVIKLFNPNMYRDMILIDGDIYFDSTKYITE